MPERDEESGPGKNPGKIRKKIKEKWGENPDPARPAQPRVSGSEPARPDREAAGLPPGISDRRAITLL